MEIICCIRIMFSNRVTTTFWRAFGRCLTPNILGGIIWDDLFIILVFIKAIGLHCIYCCIIFFLSLIVFW